MGGLDLPLEQVRGPLGMTEAGFVEIKIVIEKMLRVSYYICP